MFVLTVPMPADLAAAALGWSLKKDLHVGIMKVSETKHLNKTFETLEEAQFKNGMTLVQLGTYWVGHLESLKQKYPLSRIIVGCMEEGKQTENVEWMKWKTRVTQEETKGCAGPMSWIASLCLQDQTPGVISSVQSTYGKIIQLMDDRFHSRNLAESQPYLSGLLNYKLEEFGNLDEFSRWKSLFSGAYDLTKLFEFGKTIVDLQQHMVNDCVEKNSMKLKLPDGQEAVAVADLGANCNMKHVRLHEVYPDVEITATLHMELGSSPSLRISLRSHGETNVASIAKNFLNGDASNEKAAGGSVPLNLEKIMSKV